MGSSDHFCRHHSNNLSKYIRKSRFFKHAGLKFDNKKPSRESVGGIGGIVSLELKTITVT